MLECSACGGTRDAGGLPGVCESCGQPYLVRYATTPSAEAKRLLGERRWNMWRYREWLPLGADEAPVTLGEGATPLLPTARLGARYGLRDLWVKDEGKNPTGSVKARRLAVAITRATRAGARRFVVPTAGNAGVALAAYASRAGVAARVFAPSCTPPVIRSQIQSFGAELVLIDGHIGDCGAAARAYAAEHGAVDVSTLREPYRIEGKKTLGLELAERLGWTLPDVIVYPTGGGTGLIGMWKAFQELRAIGWLDRKKPRFVAAQAGGCAPIVDAFTKGLDESRPWPDPTTFAAGIRVPKALGDFIVLRALRESDGTALAVSDDEIADAKELAGENERLLL